MTAYTNTLAGIANATALTTGNSAGGGDAFPTVTGTCTVTTGNALTPAYDRAITPTLSAATDAYAAWTISGTVAYARFYLTLSALPAATARVLRLYNSGTNVAELRLGTAGELILARSSDGLFIYDLDTNLSTGVVYRIELKIDGGGSPSGELRVYLGESLTQHSTVTNWGNAPTATSVTQIRFGAMFNAAATYSGAKLAAMAYSDVTWIGPTSSTLTITDTLGGSDPGPASGDYAWSIDLADPMGLTDSVSVTGSTPAVVDGSTLDVDTYLGGGLVWLYGLQEQSGATVAGDVSGIPGRPLLTPTQIFAGGQIEFGAAGYSPEGTMAAFEAARSDDLTAGGILLQSDSVESYIGGDWTIFAQVSWPPTAASARILSLGGINRGPGPFRGLDPLAERLSLHMSSGQVWVQASRVPPAGTTAPVTVAAATADNRPHWVCLVNRGGTLTLNVDGVSAVGSMPSGWQSPRLVGLTVGDITPESPHRLAWVGMADLAYSPEQVAALAMLATGGVERSDLRVARLLGWLGMSADLAADVGLSDIAYQATGSAQVLDLIHSVEDVEQGVFFAAADGRLVWRSRERSRDPVPRLYLTAAALAPDTEVQVDHTRVVNDITASRPAGRTYRAINAGSVDQYGPQTAEPVLYAATDDDLVALTDWLVYRYGDVTPRIPGLTLDLLTRPHLAAGVLGLEIGDTLQVTDLPPETPGGTTVDLTVDGIAETVSPTEWTVTLWTSAASGRIWTLDESELDVDTVLTY